MLFDCFKGELGAAVFVHNALIVPRPCSLLIPPALVGNAAIGKLPDIYSAHVGSVHIIFKALVDDIRLTLLAPLYTGRLTEAVYSCAAKLADYHRLARATCGLYPRILLFKLCVYLVAIIPA